MSEAIEGQFVKNLSARRPPRVLYHYTSGGGLIGILQSASIWATSIRFLNDSTEYSLALKTAEDVIEERLAEATSHFDLQLYRVLQDRLTNEEGQGEVYVSSFTENTDQLSQWRAYCPPAGGYAIGFNTKLLVEALKSHADRSLVPCVYDSHSQKQLICKVVDAVARFAEEGRRRDLTHDRVFRESFKLLGRLLPLTAPVIKHPTFAEEQEWRLVRLPISFSEEPHFRPG